MITFGQRLKEVRKERGLTTRQAAALIGISQPYVSQIERGMATHVASKTVTAIGAKLGLNEHWLRTGEGEKYATPQPAVMVPSPSPASSRPVLAKTTWRYRALEWLATRAGYRLVVPTSKVTGRKGLVWGLTLEEALKGMEAASRLLQEIGEGVAE